MVLTVESFFGLWFTASCGAILFAKLLNRIIEQPADNYHHTVGCHNFVLYVFQTNLNFLGLVGFSCIVYYALTLFFGLMVLLSGEMDEQCVFVNGIYYSGGFADPYHLSWQTFTTVVSDTMEEVAVESVFFFSSMILNLITELVRIRVMV
jgi:hypothetical protein